MTKMNFVLPFMSDKEGSFKETGFIELSNKENDGLAQISIYEYDEKAPDKKGVLLYGALASKIGKSDDSWTHTLSKGRVWGTNTTESTNTKKLISSAKIISGNPDCKTHFDKKNAVGWGLMGAGLFVVGAIVAAPFTAGASLAVVPNGLIAVASAAGLSGAAGLTALAVVEGGTLVAVGSITVATSENNFLTNDFPVECFSNMVYQPVIVQLKVKNATVKTLKIPGPSTGYEVQRPVDLFGGLSDIVWIEPNGLPTMTLDGDINTDGILIQANQTRADNWVDMGDVKLEIWGKMLTRNTTFVNPETDIEEPSTSPVINTEYDYGLWVAGEMVSEDFIMLPKDAWADYVFDSNYKLPELQTVEAFIQKNGHLSGIPTLDEIKKGYQQQDINKKFLEKIEELTLYKINQHQLIEDNQLKLAVQSKHIEEIKARLCKN
jgi:hypothetical protein